MHVFLVINIFPFLPKLIFSITKKKNLKVRNCSYIKESNSLLLLE